MIFAFIDEILLLQYILNMTIESNFQVTLWRHQWCHYHAKYFFGMIWDDLLISNVNLRLRLIFWHFQNGCHFEITANFLPEVIPEVEYDNKVPMSISNILSFELTEILKKIYPFQNINYFVTWRRHQWVTSARNITCTTRHRQLWTCKILFARHQSCIVKSTGQT